MLSALISWEVEVLLQAPYSTATEKPKSLAQLTSDSVRQAAHTYAHTLHNAERKSDKKVDVQLVQHLRWVHDNLHQLKISPHMFIHPLDICLVQYTATEEMNDTCIFLSGVAGCDISVWKVFTDPSLMAALHRH